MQGSQNVINLIKKFEGLRITVYKDAAGFPTIGWGHLLKPDEHYTQIDRTTATRLLMADVHNTSTLVTNALKVDLNQNQFDALISFTFNLGIGSLKQSTLLKLVNEADFECAAEEFPKWIYATVDGVKNVLPGLVYRREAEKELFLTPV